MRGFIVWLQRNEVGHKERVAEYKHSVSYINSILEGVPQCFINMRILSFKFKSNKDAESGKIVEMAQTIFGKDCDMSVQLLGLKAIMTGITAVIGLFSFLTKGPVAIILSKKYKVLLLVTIILGVGSKAMNTFYMIYNLDKFNCFVQNSAATLNGTRVAEVDSLSVRAKMAIKPFVKCVFAIFATNALFLRIIKNSV